MAGHQMARAARESDPRTACYRLRRGGVFVGKPVRRIQAPGDLGGVVLNRAAWHPHDAFRPHGAVRGVLVGDVECPLGESLGVCERRLRVEPLHDEERSEGAHEDGDADGCTRSPKDSVDHCGSLSYSRQTSTVNYPGKGDEVYQMGRRIVARTPVSLLRVLRS